VPRQIDERTGGRLERVAPRAFKLFAGPAGGMLESAGGEQQASGNAGPPNENDIKAIATQIKRATVPTAPMAGRDADREADAIAAALVARANEVLEQLRGGAPAGELSADSAYALEAVLRARGRPALNVEGNAIEAIVEQKHPGSDSWIEFRNQHEDDLVKVAGATGAVKVKDRMGLQRAWVQGTAWLIKPDLVMTNRHVLFPKLGMVLARRIPGATTTARFKSDLDISIDFAFDDRTPGRPFICPALDVVYVSEEADPTDVALIKIGPPADAAQKLATPLALANVAVDYQYIYVVGHPGKMPKVPEKVLAVFGTPDERKRVSFGETMEPATPRQNEIVYDASTIGGFSGGCVLPFLTNEVIGLHHYGDPLTGNRAFTAAALRAHAVARLLP
jgi:hypothetical protein